MCAGQVSVCYRDLKDNILVNRGLELVICDFVTN